MPSSLAILIALSIVSCAGAIVRPLVAPAPGPADALLVLPGFGYGRGGETALKALAQTMAAEGIELFVPTYISRGGLDNSRANLRRFIESQRLDRYQRLHVFAFIAGAWTFNPLVESSGLPIHNLRTVVYDRSPYQERAPRIADEAMHFRTWLRYGSPVFDVARTPYPPLTRQDVRVGLLVETRPTGFIKDREVHARSYGPFRFECDAFGQRHDDCIYVEMSHDQLYTQFANVWPEVRAFIRDGRFSAAATRTPPSGDPLGAR